jgi:hypothetical protein
MFHSELLEGGDPPYALFTVVVIRFLLAGLVLLFAVSRVP